MKMILILSDEKGYTFFVYRPLKMNLATRARIPNKVVYIPHRCQFNNPLSTYGYIVGQVKLFMLHNETFAY